MNWKLHLILPMIISIGALVYLTTKILIGETKNSIRKLNIEDVHGEY